MIVFFLFDKIFFDFGLIKFLFLKEKKKEEKKREKEKGKKRFSHR